MNDKFKSALESVISRSQEGLVQLEDGDTDGVKMTLECLRDEAVEALNSIEG